MSEQPSWSTPGPAPTPPPGPPPSPPYGASSAPPPYAPPPAAPPPRRGRGLLVTLSVLGVLVLGSAAGVVAAHGHGTAPGDVTSAPSPRTTPTSTPVTTPQDVPSAPPSTSPSAGAGYGPGPTAPDPTALAPRSGIGTLGDDLSGRDFDCMARLDAPPIGGCYLDDEGYESVQWLGSGDHPSSLGVVVYGPVDQALALQRSLPASTGMSGPAVDALVTAASTSATHTATSSVGTAQVLVGTTSYGDPRTQIDLALPGAADLADYVRAVLPAGFVQAEASATQHGYACTRSTPTQGPGRGLQVSTCHRGPATITFTGDDVDVLRSASADTTIGIDDLLSLLTDAAGDTRSTDARAIVGLVRTAEAQDVGIGAAAGFEVFCSDGGGLSCSVAPVDW